MPPGPKRVIAHLDCDAFYATVELLRRPELVGKPVIVAGSGPRAVVTTASYEARAYGVGSAMPASRARRLCPDAVVIPPDFTAYRETSKRVWELVGERLDRVQQIGIDEAYADLTGVEKPLRVLREVVAAVKEATGIVISIGVGPSRLVAKCCSDLGKPAGFVAMGREEACVRFATAPTSRVPGIGPKTADRLAELGVRTIAHLQQADEERLAGRFGANTARFLKARALFEDDSPVETERVAAKSMSSERTFDERRRRPRARSRRSCARCRASCARGSSGAAGAGARSRSRCGSTTGPRSPARARSRRPTNDAALVIEVARRAAARLRAAAPGAAARRAPGGLRGRRARAAPRARRADRSARFAALAPGGVHRSAMRWTMLIVVLAAVVAGCGGGESESLTRAEWAKRGDAACKRAGDAIVERAPGPWICGRSRRSRPTPSRTSARRSPRSGACRFRSAPTSVGRSSPAWASSTRRSTT